MYLQRKREGKIGSNSKQTTKKEEDLKKNPTKKKILREIGDLQKQIDNAISEEVYWNLKKIQLKSFEFANKLGKMLPALLKKKKERKWITTIRNEGKNGKETTDIKEIKRISEVFHRKLYMRKEIDKNLMQNYLDKLELEEPSDEMKEQLNAPITKKSEEAILNLKMGKAPGPDGFTSKFYKLFEKELIDTLQDLMNGTIKTREIPHMWQDVNISLIPKEVSVLKEPKNYRPISLLNLDYKIFTKNLADRLKKFLTRFIREDQAGFLPGQQIKDNIRTLLNCIEFYDKRPEKKVALFLLDAKKAFDNVNWDFMNLIIRKLKLGDKFENAIICDISKTKG